MAGRTWRDIFWALRQHGRKGGKKHRRRQRQRIMKLIRIAITDGAISPDHLAKRHAWQFYKLPGRAPTTLRDRFYAAKWLWKASGKGEPPNPLKGQLFEK